MICSRVTRSLRPLAALAVAALICAGCSNAPAETGTGTNAAGGASADRAKAVAYSECMRANGVKDFPDPDASGDLTIDQVANGSSLDTESAAFKQASSACKDQEPPGFTGTKRTPEQQAAALEFARCVRDNGVKDFPDPVNGEPLIDTNKIPSSAGNGIAQLNAAMKKCSAYSDGAGVKGP
jgi:hypothetical protein